MKSTPFLLSRRASTVYFLFCLGAMSAAAVNPYEVEQTPVAPGKIDQLVAERLEAEQIRPAKPCSDDVFIRRCSIDLTGTLPTQQIYRAFRSGEAAERRRVLIDQLLESESYADYWTLKWSDLLRIKAEFPINLWPNGVQAYHRWVKEAVTENIGYDEFIRKLLTSSGSNFRVPAVNFYRAIEGQKPETIAAAVSLTMMGVRFDSWSPDQQANLAHIFSKVAYKKTDEWKEEIVYLDPAQYGPMEIVFPDGTTTTLSAGADPRAAFADWLIRPENPWFARNIVNRAWSWLMGRGLIHEPDDIRDDNPCVNPPLLAYLEEEFIRSGYDIKHLFRLITNSRTYQQSSIPQSTHPEAEALFAHYIVRRLDAEVLIDALNSLGGQGELYQSPVPEPFTFVPEYHKTVELSDGSITSQFLEKFGRPGRDTGLESERSNDCSVDQSMYLLNSSEVKRKLAGNWRMKKLLQEGRTNPRKAVTSLYRQVLTRKPTEDELSTSLAYIDSCQNKREAMEDVCWALINSKEFLYRH